jgi:hypothetical protein
MNMQTTGGCGRVAKNKNKDGSIRSFGFSIVKNLRVNSKPTHVTLEKILTLKQTEFASQANAFWKKVDETVAALTKTGKLWANDKSKIEKRFSDFIPRPAAVIKTVATATKSNQETLRKLKERGITL